VKPLVKSKQLSIRNGMVYFWLCK